MASLGEEIGRNKAMWMCPKVIGPNPSERWGHSSCYFNGLVYIFGGCRGGVHFSDVLVCNLEMMTWTILKTFRQGPGPRDSHSVALVGHKMLVFGGTDGSKKVNDLYVLDLLSREWTQPECYGNLPLARESHTVNALGDEKLVVFGGSGEGEGNYLNDLHVLDLKTMEWYSPEVRGDIPAPRDSHSSVAVGNRLFVFGGDSGDRYQGDVAVLDMTTLVWSRLDTHGPSPGPRAGHASVSVGTKVYVFGGVGDKKYYNDIWILDVITLSWIKLDLYSQKSQGRFSHTATVTHLGIAIFGGCGEDERPLNELLVLQLEPPAWRSSGNNTFKESQVFREIENNQKTTILVDDEEEDLNSNEVEELEFISKESFRFSSDMLHPKRRRTRNLKELERKPELEEHCLSHSHHSSPSISDHEQTPVKKSRSSYLSSRVHPHFRQRTLSPNNYQLNNGPVNHTNLTNIISRPCLESHFSMDHHNQRKQDLRNLNVSKSCQVQCNATASLPRSSVQFQNLIGAEVRGQVDGAFDSGYLMTATVNGKVFRGVLFAPGSDLVARNAQHLPSFTHQIPVNHANVVKNHLNVAYPRHSVQQMKLTGPGFCSRQSQSRSPPETRDLIRLGRDSRLNSELQGVVLTLAPGSDDGRL